MVSTNLSHQHKEGVFMRMSSFETPLKYCSVSLSDVIAREKRLEASVFDVEAKQAREVLSSGRYECVSLLGEGGIIKRAYYPGRFKRIYCDKSRGEAFYLPSQMMDVYPKPEKWISGLTKCDLSELKLNKGTLLLTRSGTIGNISLVSKTTEGKIFSDDVIRIMFKDEVDLGYTYAFLKTEIGNKVLQTNGYGSVITHLEPEHLAEIRIPNAPKKIKERIHGLVVRSYELRDESNALIDEATKLLEEELKFFQIQEDENSNAGNDDSIRTFDVRLSELSGRADASYHVSTVKKIISHLRKHAEEMTNLGDSRISKKIVLAGVFQRTYVGKEYGYPFLGGKEITQLNPKVEKFLSKPIHRVRYEKELKVSENTILVTDRGTIGTVTLVPKHWSGYAVSQNVLKLVPADNDIAGYTYIYLNTDVGRHLIRRQTYGSVVDMIDNRSLASVEIPLLKNKEIQTQINQLALEANARRYEAYCLEEQAIKIMNEEVIGSFSADV